MTGYDVIGDVHGHADALTGLLRTMGYAERNGAWGHASRQAVFVGDIIDHGPQQLETIDIVRRMVDAGTAQVVLGNHEFNAVAFATSDARGDHLRTRSKKNRKQHAAFLAAVGLDSPLHRELVDWFTTIPLWLELDGLRVIHACWSEPDLDHMRGRVSETNSLETDLVVDASTDGHRAFAAVETLLKGPEISFPMGSNSTTRATTRAPMSASSGGIRRRRRGGRSCRPITPCSTATATSSMGCRRTDPAGTPPAR